MIMIIGYYVSVIDAFCVHQVILLLEYEAGSECADNRRIIVEGFRRVRILRRQGCQ